MRVASKKKAYNNEGIDNETYKKTTKQTEKKNPKRIEKKKTSENFDVEAEWKSWRLI